MVILLAKAGVSLVLLVLLVLALWQRPRLEAYLGQTEAPWLGIFYTLFRLVPFLITFVVLPFEPTSDVGYFYPIIKSAGRLEVPYRDVYSCYSPFFGHWLALPLMIADDLRTIVLMMTLAELGVVWLTARVYGGRYTAGERRFRSLLYFMLPISLEFCIFSGQEDVLLWGLALLAVWWWQRTQNAMLGGVLLGLGLLLTKATFVLMILPIFLLTNQKVRLVAGLALVGLPVFIWLYVKTGTLFIAQQVFEGTYLKAPNWRSILNPVLSGHIAEDDPIGKWVTLGILFLLIVGATQLVRKRMTLLEAMPMLFIVIHAAMSMLQQNAISNYAYTFMVPLVFCVLDLRRTAVVGGLLAFNVLAANHPSLWWRLKQPYYDSFRELANPIYLGEYLIECLIVAGYVALIVLALRALRRGESTPRKLVQVPELGS